MPAPLPAAFAAWFAARAWTPRPHPLAMCDAARAGDSVLLIAPAGGGKMLAGFLPSLIDLAAAPRPGLHTRYLSPLKALATDIARNLLDPVRALDLPVAIETRIGDTPANRRARQRATPPHILRTTPESLALLLSLPDAPTLFAGLQAVVIDEVHALAGGKRRDLLARVAGRLVHIALSRVSPRAMPVLLEIGRESVRGAATEEALIAEATDAAPPEPASQARQDIARQGIARQGSLFGSLFPA